MTCRLARYRGRIDPCRYNTANHLSSRPTPKEPAPRETEEEWRDPEAVSSPMLIQGVSTRALSRNPVVIRFVRESILQSHSSSVASFASFASFAVNGWIFAPLWNATGSHESSSLRHNPAPNRRDR